MAQNQTFSASCGVNPLFQKINQNLQSGMSSRGETQR